MRVRRRRPPGRLAWLSCLALATVLLACGPACAEPFALDPASGARDVRGRSEVLRDPGGHWSLADVLARQSLFLPADTLVPDARVSAFSPGTVWYRLQPRSDSPGPWFLDGAPEIDRGEAILVRADGRVLRVERDRLSTMALTDGLTGIANRRSFDQRFDEEWRRAVRGGTPLAVAMFDVDCFKSYNDTFGHAAGDLVLSRVAAVAALSLERAEDFLARYGGEEFVAVLPGMGAEAAAALAEKVRLAVQALQLAHPGSDSGCVTLSGGVASATPEPVARGSELPAIELLRAADAALYEARNGGRNQVRVICTAARSEAEQARLRPDLPKDRVV